MIVVTKRFFLVEWLIPIASTPEDWGAGLRIALPFGSKFYGVAAAKSIHQWVGRVVVTVRADEYFTPQSTFERVMTSVVPRGDPKFEQRAHI